MEDRLYALTAASESDYDLPEVQGVQLITTGNDAGLYQITVVGYDGSTISLGRVEGIQKASSIHDMIAIGLYGRNYRLNFNPRRYTIESYIDVLLTFQKLFPGNRFWEALKRGIEIGVKINQQDIKKHPVLEAFYKHHTEVLNREFYSASKIPSVGTSQLATGDWPPFCPPWMLPRHPVINQDVKSGSRRKKAKCSTEGRQNGLCCKQRVNTSQIPEWCDAAVTIFGIEAENEKFQTQSKKVESSSYSKETMSIDQEETNEVSSTYYRPSWSQPSNGVVQRRVNEPFTPPKPVIEYDYRQMSQRLEGMEFSPRSRRTRRGRSVRQPARYREDAIQFSDSDNGDELKRKRMVCHGLRNQMLGMRHGVKMNGSTHVVGLPHVRPIPKLDAVAIDDKAEHFSTLYNSNSQFYPPYLKPVLPTQNH